MPRPRSAMTNEEVYNGIKSGAIIVTQKSPVAWRFWLRVDKNGPIHPTYGQCWVWAGKRINGRYGVLRSLPSYTAHRYSWTLHFGVVPTGLEVMHKCDNPVCVNPSHLEVGTHAKNMRDIVDRGRLVKGEALPQSVLTDEQVRYARKRYRRYSHKDGCGAIARELGVSLTAIWKAIHGIHWSHVT